LKPGLKILQVPKNIVCNSSKRDVIITQYGYFYRNDLCTDKIAKDTNVP